MAGDAELVVRMKQLLDTSIDYATAFQGYWKQTTELPNLGIAVLDRDAVCVYSNAASRRMLFHDTNFNPVGHRIDALEGSAFHIEATAHFRSVIETGLPIMIRFTRYGTRLESVLTPWHPTGTDTDQTLVISFTRECASTLDADVDIPVYESQFNSWGELDHLTNRQLEVLAALRQGLSQREIADLLGIALKTVETHRDQLVHRLGLRSTIEAVRLADRAGLTLENSRLPRHTLRPWQSLRDDERADSSDSASNIA